MLKLITQNRYKIFISIAELYIKTNNLGQHMGNFCTDSPYYQLKELYPHEFPKLIENHYLQKQIHVSFDTAIEKLNTQTQPIQKQLLGSIGSKSDEIKQHFERLKEKIEKQYSGGVSLLQKQKKSRIQDFLMYNYSLQQYQTTKKHAKNMFLLQKNKAKAILQKLKEQQIRNLRDSTPHLQNFQALSEKAKQEIYLQGKEQYEDQIGKSSEQLSSRLLKNIKISDLLDDFKRILPIDKLDLLTKVTKHQMSQKMNRLILQK